MNTRPKTATIKERDLQRAAFKYLAERRRYARDVQFAHIPNEIRRSGRAARFEIARKKQEGLVPGAPDLIVWTRGRVVSIELKVASRPQSEAQQEFERSLNALDHEYHLVRAKEPHEIAGLIEAIIDAA